MVGKHHFSHMLSTHPLWLCHPSNLRFKGAHHDIKVGFRGSAFVNGTDRVQNGGMVAVTEVAADFFE